jgi:hypothetical protein
MEILTILGILTIVGLAIYLLTFAVPPAGNTDKVVLFDNSIPGDNRQSIPLALPRSYNQPEGLTYSYVCWLLVKDFTKGYGERRRIFSKGDSPGLYIDSTSNSLVVAIDTYGTTETILIPNIPAMKWIHFAMVVDQHSVDIYINGILKKHHTLGQLPQLNDDVVSIGSNWDGVIARLTYYSRSLNHVEIKTMVKEKLPDDLQRKAAPPNYFDISWYIGRLYSA